MKLFLSSFQLGNNPDRLSGLVGPNKKVAIIMNAGDAYGDSERPKYLAGYAQDLMKIGLIGEELDLRLFFGKSDRLEQEIRKYGLIWAVGGNSFNLMRAMHLSGLKTILPKVLKDSDLVYGGFSAGACIVTPSLHGIELVDNPSEVPLNYPSEIIWNGISLVDFHIAPHFKSPHPESAAIDKVVDYFENHKMKYQALMDGEAIVINASKMEKI